MQGRQEDPILVTCRSLASRHWSFASLSPSNQYPPFNPHTHIKGTLPQPQSQAAVLQCVNAWQTVSSSTRLAVRLPNRINTLTDSGQSLVPLLTGRTQR